VWLTLGLAIVLASVGDSDARLHPYYVLRTSTGDTDIKPRILFVLDSSGSMGMRAQPDLELCEWDECEDPALAGTTQESRMAAARRAVNEVITATEDQAKFALMTFLQHGPHGTAASPQQCNLGGGVSRRFVWIDEYRFPYLGFNREAVDRDGHVGAWRLCQGNDVRPYPYLRWDDLGVGSVIGSNHAVDPLPPSPLISTTYGDISSDSNAQRRVQWFPSFMGARFQPNDTTDPTHAITQATTGDYGTNNADRNAEVFGNDFYYWPYVDGFPGYGEWATFPEYSGSDQAGIAGTWNHVNSGKLFAPFYLDLSDTPVNPNYWGPGSEDQARGWVRAYTSPLVEGGIDAVGYTPWSSTIGPIPAAPTQSNAINAHSTVSSYLAFVNNVEAPDVCAPTAAVIITDGSPYPATEGGWQLYRRLADLRRDLGAHVYVLGFFVEDSTELNAMACAGAGACNGPGCDTPCDDDPADAWDTCADSSSPETACAYEAASADELQQVLGQIVAEIGNFAMPSGPGSTANEFGVAGGGGDDLDALQTTISASTDFPAWRGHVVREACDFRDEFGALLPQCQPPAFAEEEETFGICEQSRTWDAGFCLSQNPWQSRNLYTHDADNQLVPINEDDGTATGGFVSELQAAGAISGPNLQEQADEIAAFVLGRDAPDDWRLPGLANSAPIVVRRVPPYDPERIPSVAVRDPHCGGRLLGAADGVPASLEEYAADTWEESNRIALPSAHYEAQEAVVIGDDFGVLHAFQLDSGNELWGFVPRFSLLALAQKAAVGPGSYGQTGELEDHDYGLAATLNRGWVYDEVDARWRLVSIIGMGPGGREYVVLDLSHMSPLSSRGPLEVLWTTEDQAGVAGGIKERFDAYNGETWARPALGYHVPGDTSTQVPEAYFVMGSGYQVDGGAEEGRTLLQVDALTGEIEDWAVLPPVASDTYEDVFGTVVDPAVGTHCLSRLWAEMQEVYVADPAGRLFRWDLGRDTEHAADSNGPWVGHAAQMALDAPIPACAGPGNTCTVGAGNPAETFTFPPAVTSTDRLDDITSAGAAEPLTPSNQFLLAMVGGSPADDALSEGDGAEYHSSLYLLVDDHQAVASEGFDVPPGAPKSDPGILPGYMRMAISDIERERRFVPFPEGDEVTEVRTFDRTTRPLRAPRIFVTGVVDESTTGGEEPPTVIDGVEVYFVEFTVYEPPQAICDPNFYDPTTQQWFQDPGATYVITFRLTADVASGFDLVNGAGGGGGGGGGPADFGAGFETGLTLASVQQIGSGNCPEGDCGPQLGNPSSAPCNNNAGGNAGSFGGRAALTVSHSELSGFTPVE